MNMLHGRRADYTHSTSTKHLRSQVLYNRNAEPKGNKQIKIHLHKENAVHRSHKLNRSINQIDQYTFNDIMSIAHGCKKFLKTTQA